MRTRLEIFLLASLLVGQSIVVLNAFEPNDAELVQNMTVSTSTEAADINSPQPALNISWAW